MTTASGSNICRVWIEEERAKLAAEIRHYVANVGRETVHNFLSSRILASPENLGVEWHCRRYLAILALLEHDLQIPSLNTRQFGHMLENAQAILRALTNALPRQLICSLYSELKLLESRHAKVRGNLLEAAWLAESADLISRRAEGDSGRELTCLQVAKMLLRAGNGAIAEAALAAAVPLTQGSPQQFEPYLLQLELLRITGRSAEMQAVEQKIYEAGGHEKAVGTSIGWQQLCLEVQSTGNMLRMLRSIGPQGEHRSAERVLEATLWARAIGSRAFLDEIPQVESIRKWFGKSPESEERLEKLYACATALEQCYDGELAFATRLSGLMAILENLAQLPGVEQELLVWAAATRWLQRSQQYSFASFTAHRYESLSKSLSQGLTADGLGLQLESGIELWRRMSDERLRQVPPTVRETVERIEPRLLRRGSLMLKATAWAAALFCKSMCLRLVLDPAEFSKQRAFELLRVINHWMRALANLRGLALKLTQHVASTSPRLATDLQESLLRSHAASLPLSPQIVRDLVVSELGMPIERAFAQWHERPLSCGSMGQVHRGVTHDGRHVVFKIQYPNIERIARADLRLFKLLMPIFRLVFPFSNVAQVVSIFERSLQDDLDYSRTGGMHEKLRFVTAQLPNVVVPKVLPELTRLRMLTMDYVEGQRMNEFLATSNEAARHLAFDAIVDFYMTILIDHRVVCGDIHPGNFLFLRDGRVAVIDLGYAEIYPSDRLQHWVSLVLAVIREDGETLRREAVALGLVKNLRAMSQDQADQIVRAAQRILHKGKAVKLDRSAFFEGLRGIVLPDELSTNLQLPVEDVRLVHGVLSLFGVLVDFGLEVPWGDRLEQWLMPYAELRKAG